MSAFKANQVNSVAHRLLLVNSLQQKHYQISKEITTTTKTKTTTTISEVKPSDIVRLNCTTITKVKRPIDNNNNNTNNKNTNKNNKENYHNNHNNKNKNNKSFDLNRFFFFFKNSKNFQENINKMGNKNNNNNNSKNNNKNQNFNNNKVYNKNQCRLNETSSVIMKKIKTSTTIANNKCNNKSRKNCPVDLFSYSSKTSPIKATSLSYATSTLPSSTSSSSAQPSLSSLPSSLFSCSSSSSSSSSSLSWFTICIASICILAALTVNVCEAGSTGAVRPGTGNPSPRLPRTSASQLNSGNGTGSGTYKQLSGKTFNTTTRTGNLRTREQQLLGIFEVIISTLENKLKRIDNLDKSVEHMMRRMEILDNRVADNLIKTESVITKLRSMDTRLGNDVQYPSIDVFGARAPRTTTTTSTTTSTTAASPTLSDTDTDPASTSTSTASASVLDNRLVLLDQKVSDIDSKLEVLKTQIDNNFLQVDDFNVEASEKKPISMNVIEITKAMNAEVMNHVSTELNEIRDTTDNIDKKLQFHINIVSENVGRMLRMVGDIHEAVVDHNEQLNSLNATTTALPLIKSSKIDALVKQIRPMVSVSEKMDEVWDVVVGTKSSVDHLLPKSDALLTQTQRQERAIGEIHNDLKAKTNLIINNLDMVEKRLKKQEDDVQILAQRPVPAELLMDPTIDRLVEYDPNRYSVIDEYTEPNPSTTPLTPTYSTPTSSSSSSSSSSSTSSTSSSSSSSAGSSPSAAPVYTPTTSAINPTLLSNPSNQTASTFTMSSSVSSSTANLTANSAGASTSATTTSKQRKGGIIFPSVKNKPSVVNTTFSTELLTIKDIKGFSCVDLLNAGMRQSGVFYLQIRGTTYWFLKVFCEQEIADGGWTVIQRRDDFGEPRENFNRDWADYKNGFGDPAKEFWLGNENIYMLTNNEDYALRIELEDFEGNKRYAQYSHFKIHSEADYYKLEIDGYEGNAGDSLNDPWYGSNNSPFSTYNRDNDRSSLNCASMLKGGWWWKSCGRGLNGLYLHDPQDLTARQGIVWFRWRGWDYTLKKATMMIRPRTPQPMASSISLS